MRTENNDQDVIDLDMLKPGRLVPAPASEQPASAIPERPEAMVKALAEGVEYVDATELIGALLAHTERLHKLTEVVAHSLAVTQKSLIRANQKLIELEADMAVAGAGVGSAAGKGSKLIGIGDAKDEVIRPSRTVTRIYGRKPN